MYTIQLGVAIVKAYQVEMYRFLAWDVPLSDEGQLTPSSPQRDISNAVHAQNNSSYVTGSISDSNYYCCSLQPRWGTSEDGDKAQLTNQRRRRGWNAKRVFYRTAWWRDTPWRYYTALWRLTFFLEFCLFGGGLGDFFTVSRPPSRIPSSVFDARFHQKSNARRKNGV